MIVECEFKVHEPYLQLRHGKLPGELVRIEFQCITHMPTGTEMEFLTNAMTVDEAIVKFKQRLAATEVKDAAIRAETAPSDPAP